MSDDHLHHRLGRAVDRGGSGLSGTEQPPSVAPVRATAGHTGIKVTRLGALVGRWECGYIWAAEGHWITGDDGIQNHTWLALGRRSDSGMLILVVGPLFLGLWRPTGATVPSVAQSHDPQS